MGRFDDDPGINPTQFSNYPDQVRHPPNEVTIGTSPATVVSVDEDAGFDSVTSSPLIQVVTAYSDGTTQTKYLNPDRSNFDMTIFNGFTAEKAPAPSVDWENDLHLTDLSTGQITDIKTRNITVFKPDNTADEINSSLTYFDNQDNDLTAAIVAGLSASTHDVGDEPTYVQTGTVDGVVTGIVGIGLGALPANTAYGTIYIQVDADTDAAGVAFTTDGVAPSDTHQFQTSKGSAPIKIANAQELANLLMVPIGADGEIDGALSVQFSAELGNTTKD